MEQKLIKRNHTSHLAPHNSQKGITLIALVVTIVVLLILTAVTITLVTGDESVISQAKDSKQQQQESSDMEAIKVAVSAQNMKLAIANGNRTDDYFNAIEEELEDRYESVDVSELRNRPYSKNNRRWKRKKIYSIHRWNCFNFRDYNNFNANSN